MSDVIGRRTFLKSSIGIATAMAAWRGGMLRAEAAPIDVPTIDRLRARVLVDSSFDLFARPSSAAGVSIATPPRTDSSKNLHSEWGLSLHLQSERSGEQRNLMLDFGYSGPVLLNNIQIVGVGTLTR